MASTGHRCLGGPPPQLRSSDRVAGVNRLAAATSPYLLQHQDNPVDRQEWGPQAFAEARERDVPLLISVGYSACH